MKTKESQGNKLTRREFISRTTMAGVSIAALRFAPIALAKEAAASLSQRSGEPVRISNTAYYRAQKCAKALVKKMTLEEKISQLGSTVPAIERLNVPKYNYYTGEALHGLLQGPPVTSFPVPLALAASWNPELALRIYTAVSDEARAYDNRENNGLSYYSPVTLNLHRDPRWGRCEEVPGEDPCLASTLAVEMVRGMQGDNENYLKTTACSKHFICNNTDDDRMSVSATVDERSFWEYYTRAYRSTILEGDVFTVMGAYSALNGIPCCASHFLMTDLLRDRWGFRGYVTSDCDAIDNIYDPHHYAADLPIASAMAVTAGCDLNCGGTLQANLKAAIDRELIGEEDIDLSVTRVMTVRYLLGLFDPPTKVPYTKIPFEVVDSPEHRELALEAARQTLVLLKNDSKFLPLDKNSIKKIAVIGPLAEICLLGGYSGAPTVRVSPYQAIAETFGVTIYRPYIDAEEKVNSGGGVRLQSSSEGGMDLCFITNNSWAEYSKIDFSGKTEFQVRVSSAGSGGKIEVHLDQLDGPLACELTVPRTGDWQKWVNVSAPLTGISGVHNIFLKFLGSGGSLFNVEQFQLNPPTPPPSQHGKAQVVFKKGCTVTGAKDEKMFKEAVDAAQEADVVVLVCGVNEQVDREGVDRKTIGLTGAQPELTQAILAANPKTVLVLSTNNSVAVEWEQEHFPAILCAVCAGQAQGTAITDVLFGDYNPGGKLPFTWYRSIEQLPPKHDYDISKGRTYLYFEGSPLYPFGYGLSYTTFQIKQLQLSAAELGPGETVKVSATVTNTGRYAGAEIVQLYITPPPSPIKRPIKQLVGFQRVELKQGESKTITFELPYYEQAFWYWDEKIRNFTLQQGGVKIHVGNSSDNLPLTSQLMLKGGGELPADARFLNSLAVKSQVT
jgi:beta-glucosidase